MLFLGLAVLLAGTLAHWATYYSFDDGKIYMRLKNDEIVALNFSVSGFLDSDHHLTYSETQLNLNDGQLISSLVSSPKNSTLFLHGSTLFALLPSTDSLLDYDVCGDGIFRLVKYNSQLSSWDAATTNMTFSNVNDLSYYEDASIFTDGHSDSVFIYGGRCASTGEPTNRLLSLNMDTFSFSNISTSTQPQPFYGASSQWAPNPQNSLVIGGKASGGWLNMYQLATWNFDSGWLFQQVQKNDTSTVHSRINHLVLPVFSPLKDNSSQTFSNDYRPLSLIVIGGDSSDGPADPDMAEIIIDHNNWSWRTLYTTLDTLDIMGAAIVFNTLVVVNGLSISDKRDNDGSGHYHVNLYDVAEGFRKVSDLQSNTKKISSPDTSSKSSSSVTQKAVIGTLVPVAALAIAAAAGLFIWKKKAAKHDDNSSLYESMEYQLGHYRTASDQFMPTGAPKLSTDSGSTISEASINSWVKKKHEYETKRHSMIKRNSFLCSNETLDGVLLEKDEESDHSIATHPRTLDPQPPSPARVNELKQFHSYSHSPPTLPLIKKGRRHEGNYTNLAVLQKDSPFRHEDDDKSFDEQMDVQVLVSSKRKSVLRVVNPDVATISDEDLIRQRTPSK